MNRYQYKDLFIEVFNDSAYNDLSVNKYNYPMVFFDDEAELYPTSNVGVKIYRNKEIIDSCIFIGSGGATGIHQNSSILDNNQLVICCCNTVFCLSLPNLNLKWKTKADPATCFQIFQLQDDYLVHGELEITRIGKDGKIKWQFGGADILVSTDGEEEIKFEGDHIILTDYGKNMYKIDFNGKLLSTYDTSLKRNKNQ